jgi:hypothetical protein
MGLNRNLGNLTEVITEGGGNIGIGGTPNAGFRVDVNGTGRFSSTVQASAFRLTGMTAGSGALYWSSDRVTLANYNPTGVVMIEANGGAAVATFGGTTFNNDFVGTGRFGSSVTVNGTATFLGQFGNGNNVNEKIIQFTRAASSTDIVNIQGINAGVGAGNIALQASGGNVGIGTASPSQKLTLINGTFQIGGTSTFLDNIEIGRVGADNNMAFATGGTERMRIFSNGNVLIQDGGTFTNGGYKLDVNGTGRFNTVSAGYTLTLQNVKDDSEGLLIRSSDNDGGLYLLNLQSSNGATSQSWVDRFNVTKNGNVGIGTVPQTLTHLYTATARAIPALGSAGGHFMIQTGGVIATIMGVNANGNFYLQPQHINAGGSTVYNTLLNPSGGNVAVGINYSPTAKLHVEGQDIYLTGNTDNRIRFSNFGFTGNNMGAAIGYVYNVANTQESGSLAFYTNPNFNGTGSLAEQMRITSNGNINFNATVYNNTAVATTRTLYIGSDYRIGGISSIRKSKKNIENISNVDWIYQLNPVTFNYRKKDEEGEYTEETYDELVYGLIAEDTESIADFLINYNENDGEKEMIGIEYSRLITPMLKAIQELKAEIEILKQNK